MPCILQQEHSACWSLCFSFFSSDIYTTCPFKRFHYRDVQCVFHYMYRMLLQICVLVVIWFNHKGSRFFNSHWAQTRLLNFWVQAVNSKKLLLPSVLTLMPLSLPMNYCEPCDWFNGRVTCANHSDFKWFQEVSTQNAIDRQVFESSPLNLASRRTNNFQLFW